MVVNTKRSADYTLPTTIELEFEKYAFKVFGRNVRKIQPSPNFLAGGSGPIFMAYDRDPDC